MRGLTAAFVVNSDHVLHPDGAASVVVRSGDLDLDALDPARRSAALAAFSTLCHQLESPLQILVRTRRLNAEWSHAGDALEVAMQAHRLRRLAEAAPHRRDILLVAHGPDTTSAHSTARRVMEMLQAMGTEAALLRSEELRALLPQSGVTWSEEPAGMRWGDLLCAGYAVRRLPGHAVRPGWLRPLFALRVDCDIAIHLSPAPLSLALRSLGRRLRDFSAHRMIESERGSVADVHVDIGLDAAYALRGRLARRHGRALHLSIVGVAQAHSKAELERARGELRSAFQATLLGVEPLHFRSLAARVSTLPLGLETVRAHKLIDSAAAASCVPWVEARCDDAGGYRLGEARTSQEPVSLMPFDVSRHRNANIAVLASSGHGKSFALGLLVIEASLRGVDSIVLDPEGEHASLVESLHGSYLALSPGSGAALNIFDSGGDDDEAAVAAVTDLISVLCGQLGDVDRAHADAAARDALHRAAQQQRRPVLEDCMHSLLRSAPQVAVVLRRYCSGALGGLFNSPTTVTIEDGVCGVSLRDMPPEHMAAATLILGRRIWALVQQRRRRRHVVVDEAGALCTHPALRSLLLQLARRCRKYGSSLVVATQNAQDLLGSDEGTVVATNCATVLLGGQRPADTLRMEQAFGLTASQRRFLETAGRGEFLLLTGERRLEITVDVPPEYARILRKPAGVAAV